MKTISYRVTADDEGMRLDRFCNKKTGAPISLLNKAFRKGLIRVDGKKCEGNLRIEAGQEVAVRMAIDSAQHTVEGFVKKLDKRTVQEALDMVMYRNAHIIIINKPPGLAVQGGSKISKHLDGMLPALQGDAAEPPRLVHRLDKDTSGVMVLARTAKVARELQHLFAQRRMQKTYLALVHGVPIPFEGEITSRMAKEEDDDGYEKVQSGEHGKKAVSYYRVHDHAAKTAALVELQPITGRTHQLRVHASEAGWPIVGDGKYSTRDADSVLGLQQKLHLHAWRLSVPELFGDDAREFEAPLPKHMRESCERLGLMYES